MLTKKVGSIMFYIKTHTTIHNFKKLFTLLITNIGSNEPILSCTYMCVRKPFPCWLTLNIAYRRLRHRFFCRLPNLFLCACNLSSTIFAKFFCYLQKKKKRIGDWFVLKLKEHVRIISQIFFMFYGRLYLMLNSVVIFVWICAISIRKITDNQKHKLV